MGSATDLGAEIGDPCQGSKSKDPTALALERCELLIPAGVVSLRLVCR